MRPTRPRSSASTWRSIAVPAAHTARSTDACPHRKVPLSMGRVQGDDIECGYHGLRVRLCRRVRAGTGQRSSAARGTRPLVPDRASLRSAVDLDGRRRTRRTRPTSSRPSTGEIRHGDDRRRRHDRRLQLPAHHRQPARSVACRLGASRVVCRRRVGRGPVADDGRRRRRDDVAMDAGHRARAVLRAVPPVRRQL